MLVDGVDLRTRRPRQVARRLAIVDQEAATELDLTRAGRRTARAHPPPRATHGARDGDRRIATEALAELDLSGWERRRWHTLSGCERQRVQIARALAQRPSELLLDEPTNQLDIRHQLDVLDLVNRLDVTAVVALYDLNLAAACCDCVALLRAGRILAAGESAAVLTSDRIRAVYDVRCEVRIDADGRPTITLPAPRSAPAAPPRRPPARS